tara:strand:+ start:96 stop:389 length:294 start_codon:yes stop_codon:yes gene_type:complete
MAIYIKTEHFTKAAENLSNKQRTTYINQHKEWVNSLKKAGFNIKSGYLVNKDLQPGGGGLMIIEVDNYDIAENIIRNDPMIKNKLVEWELHEWIKVD